MSLYRGCVCVCVYIEREREECNSVYSGCVSDSGGRHGVEKIRPFYEGEGSVCVSVDEVRDSGDLYPSLPFSFG